jgi:hypothetical protein
VDDVYNYLPELSREERSALLERAVLSTFEARGGPCGVEAQLSFDLAVDLHFTVSELMLRHSIAAQLRQIADEAELGGA